MPETAAQAAMPQGVDFIYDAIRKVATARARDPEGQEWRIEFVDRLDDDSMTIVVRRPGGGEARLTVREDEFVFSDNTVTPPRLGGTRLFMHPIYIRKLRGFTRGNIPTPDISGPTLP